LIHPRFYDFKLTGKSELKWWLINAFNGEWAKITNVVPNAQIDARAIGR
jgi:hypothetical protein